MPKKKKKRVTKKKDRLFLPSDYRIGNAEKLFMRPRLIKKIE